MFLQGNKKAPMPENWKIKKIRMEKEVEHEEQKE